METPTGLTAGEAIELGGLLFKLDEKKKLTAIEHRRFLVLVARVKKLPAINETVTELNAELFWKQLAEDTLKVLAVVARNALVGAVLG